MKNTGRRLVLLLRVSRAHRVVQTDPGPMPTLTTSAPLRISCSVISGVTTFPAKIVTWTEGDAETEDHQLTRQGAPRLSVDCSSF
jgi:hypothetical protein